MKNEPSQAGDKVMIDYTKWPHTGHIPAGLDEFKPSGCKGNCDGECEEYGRRSVVTKLVETTQERDQLKKTLVELAMAIWDVQSEIGVHPAAWEDPNHPEDNYSERTPEQNAWNEKVMHLFNTMAKLPKYIQNEFNAHPHPRDD